MTRDWRRGIATVDEQLKIVADSKAPATCRGPARPIARSISGFSLEHGIASSTQQELPRITAKTRETCFCTHQFGAAAKPSPLKV